MDYAGLDVVRVIFRRGVQRHRHHIAWLLALSIRCSSLNSAIAAHDRAACPISWC